MRIRSLLSAAIGGLLILGASPAIGHIDRGPFAHDNPGVVTPGLLQGGDIAHVANIPYAQGTDIEFGTYTVTKLSGGATGTPVCQKNADGTCMTDANGKTIFETELRDFAFVGSEAVNGYVIDITNPTTPVNVATLPCKASQNDIQLWNTVLLQSDDGVGGRCTKPTGGTQTGVTIGFSDITNPRAPKYLGRINESRGAHNATVHPTKPIVYISDSDLNNTGLGDIPIYDFTNPAAPVKKANFKFGAHSPHDITFNAAGTRAYVAAVSLTYILDTTDAIAPVLVSVIPNEGISISHGADPTPDEKFLLVGDEVGGGGAPTASPGGPLHVYDIRVKERPVKIGVIADDCVGVCDTASAVHTSTAHVVRINPDGYSLAMGWYHDGAWVFDTSDMRVSNVGGSGATAEVGSRVVGWMKMPSADVWSAKMYQERLPGYLFANNFSGGRGFDVFYVSSMGGGFIGFGTIDAGQTATYATQGTGNAAFAEFTTNCDYAPAANGSDAWLEVLPAKYADGTFDVTAKARNVAGPYDLDLYFFDANCVQIGRADEASTDQTGTAPEGTAYVGTTSYTGGNVSVILSVAKTPEPPPEE